MTDNGFTFCSCIDAEETKRGNAAHNVQSAGMMGGFIKPYSVVRSKSDVWTASRTIEGKVPHGMTLRVGFFDGTADMHALTMRVAAEWLWAPNIRLRFKRVSNVKAADIRVTFATNRNFSKYGTQARNVPKGRSTMELQTVAQYDGVENAETRHIILHEFGHALGLRHELRHPSNDFDWDEDAIVDYFRADGMPDWGGCKSSEKKCRASVRTHITRKFKVKNIHLVSERYDGASVMNYAVDPSWTKNAKVASRHSQLSYYDKAMIERLYR